MKKRILGPALITLIGILALAAYLISSTWETRDDIPESYFLDPAGGWERYLPEARSVTSTVCAADVPCTWAVKSPTALVMKFNSQDAARSYVQESALDARQSSWIVVEFANDGLNPTERHELIAGIDGIHVSED